MVFNSSGNITKIWLRIVIYTLLVVMIIGTSYTIIRARNFYGITLNDLARQGDTATKEITELSKTVVAVRSNYGSGSGVIVYADKLFIYILTNNHVVRGLDLDSAYVKFIGGMTDTCVKHIIPIAYEQSRDLAIICIPRVTEDFRIAELAEEKPNIGDDIMYIGFPLRITHFVSRGTYSSESRYDFQSDLTVAPGASGSPVFNSSGKVVGLIKALNTIPLPKTKFWSSISKKDKSLYLVNFSVGINLKTIKKFLGRLNKCEKINF